MPVCPFPACSCWRPARDACTTSGPAPAPAPRGTDRAAGAAAGRHPTQTDLLPAEPVFLPFGVVS